MAKQELMSVRYLKVAADTQERVIRKEPEVLRSAAGPQYVKIINSIAKRILDGGEPIVAKAVIDATDLRCAASIAVIMSSNPMWAYATIYRFNYDSEGNPVHINGPDKDGCIKYGNDNVDSEYANYTSTINVLMSIVATSAHYSYMMAKYVVKDRWEPGEAAIQKEPAWLDKYVKFMEDAGYYDIEVS